ncbi:MAG: Hydantoin racemase [Jatrophihabitantaceae bacterium]|nr:Hydantoin racemase [Jatrophihabitantaceae bacterium]
MIVLGCAGMADFCSALSAHLGVPVIDGVSAATLMVQSLVTMGLRPMRAAQSRTGGKHIADSIS